MCAGWSVFHRIGDHKLCHWEHTYIIHKSASFAVVESIHRSAVLCVYYAYMWLVSSMFPCIYAFYYINVQYITQEKGRATSGQPSSAGPSVSVNSSPSLPPVCAASGVPNGHIAPPTSSPNFPVRPQLPIPSEWLELLLNTQLTCAILFFLL